MRGLASQHGSPEVAGVVAAAAVEATTGMRDARVALMVVVRCYTRSFTEFGVERCLLGMLAGDEEDDQRARWLR